MKTLWCFATLLALASLAGTPGIYDEPRTADIDYIRFDEDSYEYVCGDSFPITVRYFGPHIVTCWIWFEFDDGLVVDWQNIVPGSGWHTEWNDWSVQTMFIGGGPGWQLQNRLIVWMYDFDYGADGDGKPLFVVEGVCADSCYTGDIVAVVEERENIYGQGFHDIFQWGYVQGYMPSAVRDMTWGTIKALYR